MSLKVAELFVDLGIKGSDVSVRALVGVQDGLEKSANSGLALKAAIIAAFYAMERLTSAGSKTAAGLFQFQQATGISSKLLQQWQVELLKFNVPLQEVQNTFAGISEKMADIALNGQPPKWLGQFMQLTNFDRGRMRDTGYVLEKLRELSQMKVAPDILRNIMHGLGLSDAMIAGLKQSKSDISKNPVFFSQAEEQRLARMSAAWDKLWVKVQTRSAKLFSGNGNKLLSEITKFTDALFNLAEALTAVADKLKVFEIIGKLINLSTFIANGSAEGIPSVFGKKTKYGFGGELDQQLISLIKGDKNAPSMSEIWKNFTSGGTVQNNHNTTVHVHTDTKNPRDHGKIVAQEINNAVQQSPGLVQSR